MSFGIIFAVLFLAVIVAGLVVLAMGSRKRQQ